MSTLFSINSTPLSPKTVSKILELQNSGAISPTSLDPNDPDHFLSKSSRLTRDREVFDAGGLKSVVENRAKERKITASSGSFANLDHVSGIANQCIVGAYSVFEDYSKEKVVGEGMSGEVWKARLLQNPKWGEPQKDVVLKELKKQGLSDRKFKEILTECEVGLLLDHPLICRLLRVYDSPKSVTLVLEYCNGGDLFDRVSKAGHFIEKDVKVEC